MLLINQSSLNLSVKKILIIGTAQCVWNDLDQVKSDHTDVMVVSDIGAYLPWPVHHWVTLHPENLSGWMRLRAHHKHGLPLVPRTHSAKAYNGIDKIWDIPNTGGGSGMYAIKVALRLGYENITLAGIPMDGTSHFFDPPWVGSTCAGRLMRGAWQLEIDRNPSPWKKVRSLSGWTMNYVGTLKIRTKRRSSEGGN